MDYEDTILTHGYAHFCGKTFREIWGVTEVDVAIGVSGADYLWWLFSHHLRHFDPKPDFYAPLGLFLKSKGLCFEEMDHE